MRTKSLMVVIVLYLVLLQSSYVFAQNLKKTHTFRIVTHDNTVSRLITASVNAALDDTQKPAFIVRDSTGDWSLRIDLSETSGSKLSMADDALGTSVSVDLQNGRHDFITLPDNAIEWQIVLYSPPLSNRFVFPVCAEHVTFYYQDSLTEYERTVMKAERPDSVIGSYAVYLTPESHRDPNRCSKILHIYRPKAFSTTDTVWCDLNITEDSLSITLPQEFLDKADYAEGVVIDPTFGFDGAPASEANLPNSSLALLYGSLTAGTGYVVTELSTHTKIYSGTVTHDMGVYTLPAGSIDGGVLTGGAQTVVITNTGSRQWNSVTGLSIALSNGIEYGIACGNPSGVIRIGYDLGIMGEYNGSSCTATTLPAVWTEYGRNRYMYGIRATYTIQSGGELTRRRRKVIVGTDN